MSAAANAPSRVKSIGLEGVVTADTRLSHVDGLAGVLIIGGYELEEIAGKATFEEACYLLWNGKLPNRQELETTREAIRKTRALPEATLGVLRAAAKHKIIPMDALRMAAATLSIDDPATGDSTEVNRERALAIVSKFPTIVATYEHLRKGNTPVEPRNDLDHSANYLFMLNGAEPQPEAAKALDTYLVTVIDHGMNASTFTARVIASTLSDIYSAITGAIGALKGPLHGGAPGPALEMLDEIGTIDNAEPWLRESVRNGRRLMGFGHRVYKVRDPRADVLSAAARRLADRTGERKLYDFATEVEQIAVRVLEEEKPGRNLKTNVEFYTALVLHMVGLSTDLFSPTFAVGRAGGWTAHVLEQYSGNRLIRPASDYVGPVGLKWKPIQER